jgi:hypothetical protein
MTGQIFISYCHNDGDFAENLASKLKENGFEVWMDETALEGGDEWREEIDRSIRDSSVLVLVATPESQDSFYVTYEWIFALGAGLKVVPVKLKETEPHPRLREIHHHDFTNRRARPWDKLIADLKAICEKEHREKSNMIHEVCSIEIPSNCPPIIENAIRSLDSVNGEERENAIDLLAQCNYPSLEKLLLSVMKKHPLNDVRASAALVLGKTYSKEVLTALMDALKDTSNLVRGSAARTLGMIGDSAAVPRLIEVLVDDIDGEVRWDAAYALGEIGDNSAVPRLIEALGHDDKWTRKGAAKALGIIGDKCAEPKLKEAIRDPDLLVREEAARALAKFSEMSDVKKQN